MKLASPYKGLHKGLRSGQQPPGTSRDLNNVRPYFDGRLAVGQRDGLAKKYSQQGANAAVPVAAITTVTVVV